jgi:Fe2+ or Zn2+ uptake regulation protein
MKDAKKILEDNGISSSMQRVIILKYLHQHHNHPTVDDVYQALIDENPTLSKTTIYNTLKLFALKGIINQLAMPGNEAHYDFAEDNHAHFICELCGIIYDLEETVEDRAEQEIEGHLVMDYEIIYRGICRKCRKK